VPVVGKKREGLGGEKIGEGGRRAGLQRRITSKSPGWGTQSGVTLPAHLRCRYRIEEKAKRGAEGYREEEGGLLVSKKGSLSWNQKGSRA